MRSVSSAVETIIQQDEIALEAMSRGVLNLSAYAEEIQSEVEKITWKEVRKGTIVVALSRFLQELQSVLDVSEVDTVILNEKSKSLQSIRPKVYIDDISIRSPLCDISFEKTKLSQEATKKLLGSSLYKQHNSFFTVTEGVSEITLIAPQKVYEDILSLYAAQPFSTTPKASYQNLTGISVRFSEKYLSVPNVVYVLIGQLAVQRVNIIEVVSTFTELAVIVQEHDTDTAMSALRRYMNS
jgi:DNA-binding transcriptional regulator of glucitol operon